MEKLKLIETFDGTPSVSLTEELLTESKTDSRVDGKYIIGMIEGQFFKPDGMSRNQRWYPRSLWEKALNSTDVKNRFASSTMFGEIGHSDGPVEDMTLRQGCASHFIDKLWIDEAGHGMGRAYILNTPTGQLLKTYLGAGCKLKVSTRGEGIYKEGCTHDGCPVVDDDSYELQTADFVINPGFIETSAILKEEYEKLQDYSSIDKKQIQETIAHVKKEGEKRMTLDIDAYVQKLEDKISKQEEKIESLNEELKAKDKELLQKQFNESAEVQKLSEELAPFKKMKVSAKTLNETLKRAQESLKKEKEDKVKLSEELQSYKEICGTPEEVQEATKLSAKALGIIEEYRKIGTVEELREAKAALSKSITLIKQMHEVCEKSKKLVPYLKEAKKLEKNAAKVFEMLKESKAKKAEPIKESVKTKVDADKIKNEALELSKKYSCTVESAAKLVKKHGMEKASSMIEAALAKRNEQKQGLSESKKLVEEEAKLDKVTSIPAEKSAKDFLKDGMIRNYFNHDALGKEVTYPSINTIDGSKPQKQNAAKELLKKYQDKFEVEKAPEGLNKEITPAQAEAEAKKLLKK